MHPAALLFLARLAAPPGGEVPVSSAPPGPESPAEPARPSTLVVRARGLDEVALQRALRPRAGGADVLLLRDIAAASRDHVLVDVELHGPDLTITVLLRDGRVFVRRAPAPAGPRDAARQIASMLAAIAGDALAPLPADEATPVLAGLAEHVPADMLAPDADPPPGVSPPAGVPEPPGVSAPAGVPEPPAAPPSPPPVPEDSSSAPPAPPDASPLSPPVPEDSSLADRPAPPGARPPSLTLDFALSGAPILGLGLPDAGLRGGGGDLRLELRGARPWLVALAVRAAGHRTTASSPAGDPDRFGLARVRLSLGAGAWLQRGRLDLHLSASLSLEPWLIRHRGRPARPDGGAPAPLLGGALRLAPALVVAAPLRIGVFAELAAGATARGRAVQVSVTRGDEPSRLFTLGGLEASLGVELRIALTPSPHARTRPGGPPSPRAPTRP